MVDSQNIQNDILSSLSQDEKDIFQKILQETVRQKWQSAKSKQIQEIVPIEKWLEKEYYVGPDGANLYDYWKEELVDIFGKNNGKFNEIIVTGSIGTGKSTFALFCMLRKLYELSCYENVPALFNLMTSSMIVFIYFSLSKTQAELTGYGQMRSLVDSIPYFKKEFERNMKLQSLLKFPERILFTHGSDTSHSIGMNMIGSILDEANFFQGETSTANKSIHQQYSKTAKLYSSIVNRSKSRFMDSGVDHSLSILVSSATHSSSFTEKRIQAGLEDEHTKIINSKLWEVKPRGTYSHKKFYVFIGSDMLDPYVVETVADVNQFLESIGEELFNTDFVGLDLAISKISENYRHLFVDVPVDFKKSFQVDLINSLQDIAGVSVAPVGKLFSAKPVYNKACKPGLLHPFYKERFIIPTGDAIRVEDFLRKGFQFPDRDKPRFIHIDQSTSNDSTGIAQTYIKSMEKINGIVKPIVAVDFMLKIDPPKAPKQISITKIRDFIFYLRDNKGLNIAKVTYDWFASSESRQVLEEEGITAEHQSVDRTDQQYLGMVNLFFEERLEMYKYLPFEEELFELIHNRSRRKVDHPVNGSKDVSDALVGAINNAITSDMTDHRSAESGNIFSAINGISSEDLEDYFTMEELIM